MKGPKPGGPRPRSIGRGNQSLLGSRQRENWPFSAVFKVLLLTGQRRDEVAGMRWREVDLDAGAWTIAKERCKNGKTHTSTFARKRCACSIPLATRAAPRLIKTPKGKTSFSRPRAQLQFPASQRSKERIDARMQEILGDKYQPWRTHDLRRTAASGMAALGFQPHVIERVLNQISGAQGGLTGVYQRHEYREERKRAIMAWGEHVMQLVSAENAGIERCPVACGLTASGRTAGIKPRDIVPRSRRYEPGPRKRA